MKSMKLYAGQLWQQGEVFYRILHRDNHTVTYKEISDPTAPKGTEKQATKKEFCRLLKGAVLLPPGQKAWEDRPPAQEAS